MANAVRRFPYRSTKSTEGELALRPLLPFRLVNHDQSIDVWGLLDTGADVNVLPYRMGIELGAVWQHQRIVTGVSGNLASYEARGIILTAIVEPFEPVRLGFVWTRAEHVPLLLGRMNFFAEFNVCFFQSQLAFEISPQSNS